MYFHYHHYREKVVANKLLYIFQVDRYLISYNSLTFSTIRYWSIKSSLFSTNMNNMYYVSSENFSVKSTQCYLADDYLSIF